MSAINYTSRFEKAVFCEEDIRNCATRAMLFVNFEYRAGGEPVFRSTNVNVRENLRGKRFLGEMRKQETIRRIKAQRRTGARRSVPLKTRLALAVRRGNEKVKRESTSVRVVFGRASKC